MYGGMAPEATDIAVHAKDLTITSTTIDGHEASFTAGENDELHITSDDLQPGEHTVVIGFNGKITDAMHGLYPCYFEHDGVKKELLATQFESHHAREVFPCIDEPAAKATFDLRLTTEPDITVLGNMPVKTQQPEGDQMLTIFERTPRMSTYLLAFVTGEMQKKTAKTKDGVEVNVWATFAQPASSLDFALDIAVRSIEFYNEYFDTPYPLPKSDHVALPDFSSGAMENWGLITYREIALLADPKTTSISSRQYIATVIAHELAHQWFGNLVTMKWWNNLWLNESFATLMEYIAVDALHPEWNVWLDFATNETVIALRRDSIDGVQAVQVDVSHPDEISTLFDGAIVYAKGARLLHMLRNYVGNSAFQAGLKQYFKDFAYANTEGDDLWNAIKDASGKDVPAVMNTWISQSGFPLLRATQNGGTITLEQSRFFVGPHEMSDQTWPVPLNASAAGLPELLDKASMSLPFDDTSSLRFNIGDTAHFITYYDDALFAKIIDELKAGDLSPIDRVQILNEATLLARGGILPTDHLIPLIDAYQNETSEHVWGIVALATAELRMFIEDNPDAEKKLRQFSAKIAKKQYDRLGWEPIAGESADDVKLRSTVIAMTLYGEDQDAIARARELYNSTDLLNMDPELRPLILSSITRHGDDSEVDKLLEVYKTTSSGELRQDICVGITSTRNKDKIALLLDTIKDPSTIRPQDAARWFIYLIRGRDSRTLAWNWLQSNWQWIEDTFSGDKSYDDYPRYAASALATREQLQQYKDFFIPMQSIPALTRAISIGIGEIEGRIELIERDKAGVQKVLLAL
jgi:aminopeptidase N